MDNLGTAGKDEDDRTQSLQSLWSPADGDRKQPAQLQQPKQSIPVSVPVPAGNSLESEKDASGGKQRNVKVVTAHPLMTPPRVRTHARPQSEYASPSKELPVSPHEMWTQAQRQHGHRSPIRASDMKMQRKQIMDMGYTHDQATEVHAVKLFCVVTPP